MKSYIQGLITGAGFVFATFVFIGATDPIAIELINGLTDSVDGLTKAVENNRNRIKDNATASNKQYASFKELHLWVKQNSEAIIKAGENRSLHFSLIEANSREIGIHLKIDHKGKSVMLKPK
ncbi:MAG: hypothetical protein HOF58_02890 [Candidatus Marinimicrobia bacterium]|jgi:hypothetical protein|nr:hypothetical protein [Candidatus Neomarinimicrobiota bacterium]MBT4370038.1 hypothetical protein [Candidatus Neomarinimicrobiota bacterium]MBT4663013.1 hypothetical protein [Candidatus Neomarinimicrobiota bacterium]